MEDVAVHFRHLDLPVGLIPSADEVHAHVSETCEDQKPEKLAVCDISLDAVEDVFGQIYEEEYVKDLFNGVLEDRKNEQETVCVPYLFQCISELFEHTVFLLHLQYPPTEITSNTNTNRHPVSAFYTARIQFFAPDRLSPREKV